ncbi:MAG: S66 peptidase family protein [Lachnospira sp.]
MRYPEFLKENGTIGFVAPSFGCATEPYKTAFEQTLINFGTRGHAALLGPNVYMSSGIGISNSPKECASELVSMYISEDNEALISCGGGELMCEILEYVDFDAITAAKPKWYLGYSDNTNFTFLQNTICDNASIYGPCAATFGMNPWHEALEDTYNILKGDIHTVKGYSGWEKDSLKTETNPAPQYNITESKVLRVFDGERIIPVNEAELSFNGRLTGGCMDCLVNLLGTRFDKVGDFNDKYSDDGIIWFLESCDLNVFSIRRAMWQMDNAGWFKNVKGFLIGRPYVYGQEMMGLDQYEAVLYSLRKYNVPVIMDCDFGHLPPAMPIVSGALADIRVCSGNITIEYDYK